MSANAATTNTALPEDVLLGQGSKESGAPIKNTKSGPSNAKKMTNAQMVAVSFTQDGVSQLIKALQDLSTNERGAKLTLHYGTRTTEEGREFISSFMFVAGIQEFGTLNGNFKKSKGVVTPSPTERSKAASTAEVPDEL